MAKISDLQPSLSEGLFGRARLPSRLEAQKSIFFSLEYDPQKHARVLVLYTGGTIGMKWAIEGSGGSYRPEPKYFFEAIKKYPHLHDLQYSTSFAADDELRPLVLPDTHEPKKILYFIKEYDPLLDSSNMTIAEWVQIADDIQEHYDSFDGFVVLHGTDTMSYTASALSFMLQNLGKPVILTGSQIPVFEVRSDGRDNFVGALILAGIYKIPEVCVYFNHKLLRGNRSTKVDNSSLDAFASPNCRPLAEVGIQIYVDNDSIFRPHKLSKFSSFSNLSREIAILRIFPSITAATVRSFLQPPIKGVVLQTYGAGNIMARSRDIMGALQEAHDRGVLIVNISQCSHGVVNPAYETGKALADLGIVAGHDMTPEAALAKLSYVLGKSEWTLQQKRAMMLRNLRGELTVKQSREMSVLDADLIEAVAQVMQLSSSDEQIALRRLLFPSLICNAARIGSLTRLESIKNSGGNLSACDYDGNTALHIAASNGLIEVVKFLLEQGVNILAEDRWGLTPLDNAVQFNRFEIIELLRSCGSQLHYGPLKLASELSCAAAKNDWNRLKSFALAGANMDQEDYNGYSPILTAIRHRSTKCVKLLAEYCKQPPEKKASCGQSPFEEAERLGEKDIMDILSGLKSGSPAEKPSSEPSRQ